MQKKKRPRYGKEFKARAVQLSIDSDKRVGEVAKELGVSTSALVDWRRRAGVSDARNMDGTSARDLKNRLEQQELEIQQLKKEKKIAEMERDILKKATVFFAKENG